MLKVTEAQRGRFGTALSSLADLNGDGLRDVAVGAPLEDEHRGAVYIYLGHQHTGIRPAYSQVSGAGIFTDPAPRAPQSSSTRQIPSWTNKLG